MSAPPDPAARRGWLDTPRWMDGNAAGLASGLLAVVGVAAAVGSIVAVVLVLAGQIHPDVGVLAAATAGVTSILCLYMHRRAERFAAVRRDSAALPRERTIPVVIVPEGNWIRRALEGTAAGHLVVHEDHLLVRLRHQHLEWMFIGLALNSLAGQMRWIGLAAYAAVMVVGIVDQMWKRDSRHPWAEVPSVVSCGKTLVVEFAAADGRKDLVVEIAPRDREKILPLLRERTVVEEWPEPPKPERPRRPPPGPRPPKPPKTAIDGGTADTLDRALDGMRKLRP